ncbi:hypothetical protein CLOM_g12549 [Closterium sp. NIES-68]|nr:hypothetical protein CLOM_g2062 [Closterium sp. NIES-68]GJP53402.1 hypothetical protein CLOM_g12549 [Closterium sp. NIES-68]
MHARKRNVCLVRIAPKLTRSAPYAIMGETGAALYFACKTYAARNIFAALRAFRKEYFFWFIQVQFLLYI